MNIIAHWLKKYWPIIPVFLILIFSVLSVMEANAQEDLVAELTTRLTGLGVPVKDVTIDSKVPFQITITLQSSTTGDHGTDEDALNKYMAYREAYLADKFGLSLDSFVISLSSGIPPPASAADLPRRQPRRSRSPRVRRVDGPSNWK